MKIIVNIFYILLWALAIYFFILISKNILENKIDLSSISALAILISALLASLSVLKSINFSNQTNIENNLKRKHTDLIFLDFVLLDIYRQITFVKNEFLHLSKRHSKLLDSKHENCPIVYEADSYLVNLIISRKNQLLNRLKQLEDREILFSLDEGQRIMVFNISNDISTIEIFLDHIIHSKNLSVFNSFIEENQKLFDHLLNLIAVLKKDLETDYSDLRILSIEELKNEKYNNTNL